jgi:hypothetical protein
MNSGHGLFATILAGVLTVSLVYIVLKGNSGNNAVNLQTEVGHAASAYGNVVSATSGNG